MSPRSPEHATCPHWQKMSWPALTGSLKPAGGGSGSRKELWETGHQHPRGPVPSHRHFLLQPARSRRVSLGGLTCPSLGTVTGPLHAHHPSRLHWAGRTLAALGSLPSRSNATTIMTPVTTPWCDPILRGTRAQRGKKNLPKASQLGEWTGCHLISFQSLAFSREARPAQPAVPVCRDKGPLVGLVELP